MIDKNKIKALIFDFDLTLVDSKEGSRESRQGLHKKHGITFGNIPESELWGGTFKINSFKAKEISETSLSAEEIEELLINDSLKYYKDIHLEAHKLLREWQERGLKLCIVSGNTKGTIEDVLSNQYNRDIKFSAVYETNSGHTKANRILECIANLEIDKSETIYIGDHTNDILAAKEAGVASCAVTTGFETREALSLLKPDIIIDKLEELKKYL